MEELRRRQKDEIKVLKSIYSENFTNLNENGLSPNFKFRLTLFPTKSESQYEATKFHVQIDLVVEFPSDYPNESPLIKLENERGLSLELVRSLCHQLNSRLAAMKGHELVHELCVDIQEFLYTHNKPPSKSFFEQRLEQKAASLELSPGAGQECQSVKATASEDSKLNLEIENAVDEKKKLLQEERKKEKRERLLSNSDKNERQKSSLDEFDARLQSAYMAEIEPGSPRSSLKKLPPFVPFTIEFSEPQNLVVQCTRLLDFDAENSLYTYRAIDVAGSGELFDVFEWRICLEKNAIFDRKKLETCLAKASKIFEEFRNLGRIAAASNKALVRYVAHKFFKETNTNLFMVQICAEYVDGPSLDIFLVSNKRPSFVILDSTLRLYIFQLLNALDSLHSNHIIHRDLNPSCVYLEKNSFRIRLGKYSLFKKLNNLNDLVANEAANEITTNSKSDLHQLGLLIISLATGRRINEYRPQIPTELQAELRNFIAICLKEVDKIDCKSLRNHDFLSKSMPSDDINQIKLIQAKRTVSNNYDDDDDDLRKFTDYPVQSRLNTEFEVLGELGRGAFGEVLKVKNKLDSRLYAIKRIRINPTKKQFNKQITREIKLLSRLNHENVVRYYSTWIELYEQETKPSEERGERRKSQSTSCGETPPTGKGMIQFQSMSDDESSSGSDPNAGLVRWTRRPSANDDKDMSSINSLSNSSSNESLASSLSSHANDSSRSLGSSFTEESDSSEQQLPIARPLSIDPSKRAKPIPKPNIEDKSSDDSIIFAEATSSEEKPQKDKNAAGKGAKAKPSSKSRAKSQDVGPKKPEKVKLKRQFIYIQMEYCGGKTLKDLIEKGLYQNEDKVWSLFREILQGLNHIHEQGMIHRDLKPGNVLIDAGGHAKIGDFGLATTRLIIPNDPNMAGKNHHQGAPDPSMLSDEFNSLSLKQKHGRLMSNSLTGDAAHALDSAGSLSGAVGTALYVAPELSTPTKNRFIYTQKVDIYSLGIVFYEMWFPFPTNMERVHVILNLRQKDIIMSDSINKEQHKNQIFLIRQMLNHNPDDRPSAKDLLRSDLIPRKADEIALDELLKYSLSHKHSTSYQKIIKAVFDQQASKIDDASFDATHCKKADFKALQLHETVYNLLMRIFQRHGGYMLSYPLLTPCNDLVIEFNRAFRVADDSGLVLCLPYNHRLPFARYLARSGMTDVKRYYIGKVYTEKLKNTSLHPREHMEASFDIVTSSASDGLPEIELLTVVNDVISSTSELIEQNYILVVNHSYLLYAIMSYAGINEPALLKQIFYILADYNVKLTKAMNATKETRGTWFKDRLSKLNLKESEIERLLNYLLKYGEPDKILSDMRNLTKSESQNSKLAKDAISQLKAILNNLSAADIRIPVELSTSLVLPIISNPFEYSGFIFQLLVRRKSNKNEYDILASGGRYDNMINQFKNKNLAAQFAVGVSIDFQKIVHLISEKSRLNVFRPELAICCISTESQTSPTMTTNNSSNTGQTSGNSKSGTSQSSVRRRLTSTSGNELNSNALALQEARNRLMLFKQFAALNRNFSISTHMIHEKFTTVQEMDDYCKNHNINSYTFLNDTSVSQTASVFANSTQTASDSGGSNSSVIFTAQPAVCNGNQSYVKMRSLVDRAYRFVEKKFHLADFLANSNQIINTMGSYNSIAASYSQANWLGPVWGAGSTSQSSTVSSSFGSTISLASNASGQSGASQPSLVSYFDFLSSLLGTSGSSVNSMHMFHSPSNNNSTGSLSQTMTPSSTSLVSGSSASSALNYMSQVNFHMLQASGSGGGMGGGGLGGGGGNSGSQNRRRLEAHILGRIGHVVPLFNSRTRIEIIVVDLPDNVMQVLATSLRLEVDEQFFQANWNMCLDQINNLKHRKQLCNYRLDELVRDLRYQKRSKVFVLYNTKSDQFKLLVAH